MSKEKKNMLMPELRFPEFRDNGEWIEKILSQVANYENGKAHEQDIAEDGEYVVVNSKFISSDGEVKKYTNTAFCLATKGDILMVLSDVPNGKAIAKCFIVDTDNLYSVNQRICKITAFDANSIILFYILNRNPYFLAFDDGVKQTNLKNEDVLNFPFLLPKNPAEQQKIASCLSSLDDLIAAHIKKLDTLKAHKKGLMQQLFPAEGEKVPKLRFEEFRDSGEWVEKLLGEVSAVLMCKRIFAEETNPTTGVPFYKIGTLGGKPDAFISRELFEDYKTKYNYPRKGELLITCSGTVGKCLVYDGEDAYYQDSNIVWIDNPSFEVSNDLLYYLISGVDWSRLNSTTITRIYGADLRNLKITFPKFPIEQKKVADCLASIDKLVTKQEEKIEALKKHKNGLMQGLFPQHQ